MSPAMNVRLPAIANEIIMITNGSTLNRIPDQKTPNSNLKIHY